MKNLNLPVHGNVYRATIDKWGEGAQFDQMVEECAELIACIHHFKRGKCDASSLAHELADVALMVGQLSSMIGEELVDAAIGTKLQKLQQLLDEPQGR